MCDVFRDLMHVEKNYWAVWRNETAVRGAVFMRTLSKREAEQFTKAIWMNMFYTCACIYHSWIKSILNYTQSHGNAFCCDFFFVSMSSGITCKWPMWGKTRQYALPFALICFSIFIILLLATEAPFAWYGMSCTLLSVCGCARIKIWRAKRENEEKRVD